MELRDTVEKMVSADYKDRFIAEYQQLVIRYKKLTAMLKQWDEGRLYFTPKCPRSMYDAQVIAMSDYITALESRAVVERIDLEDA